MNSKGCHVVADCYDSGSVFDAYLQPDGRTDFWGPIGRFGWKYSHRCGDANPFDQLVAEAKAHGEHRGPMLAGIFDGSQERFLAVSDGLRDLLGNVLMY